MHSGNPQLRYVLLFGSGGIYVQLFEDTSIRVVPISERSPRDNGRTPTGRVLLLLSVPPIDESKASKRAFDYALSFLVVSIRLLTVINPFDVDPLAPELQSLCGWGWNTELLSKWYEEAERAANHDITIHSEIRTVPLPSKSLNVQRTTSSSDDTTRTHFLACFSAGFLKRWFAEHQWSSPSFPDQRSTVGVSGLFPYFSLNSPMS